MKLLKSSSGFTIVEIMIVAGIIGLLASIAIPNFIQARKTSWEKYCINNMRILREARDMYLMVEDEDDTVLAVAASDLGDYISGDIEDVNCKYGETIAAGEPIDNVYYFTNGSTGVIPECSYGALSPSDHDVNSAFS